MRPRCPSKPSKAVFDMGNWSRVELQMLEEAFKPFLA
jgi:hypothetical protein